MRIIDEIKEAEAFNALTSIFGWNMKGWLTIHLAFAFVGVVLDSVARFIDVHILSPYQLYILISLMVGLDFGTGIWLAKRRGVIATNKAMRGVWKWVAYTVLIFLATNLSRFGGNFVFTWLPTAVVTPMAVVLFLSIAKNLQLLGFISSSVFNAILNQIDKYKEVAPPSEPEPPAQENNSPEGLQ